MTLISYRAKDISPLQMRWIEPLNSLLQRYFVYVIKLTVYTADAVWYRQPSGQSMNRVIPNLN